MKGAAFLLLLGIALAPAMPSLAQAPEARSSASEEPGTVIVFPKFTKGAVVVDGVTRPQTEIEVQARCPSGATCTEDERLKIRFHWVCPGNSDKASQYVCKEADFDVGLSVKGKASFNPENPDLLENNLGSAAPCASGYLIGWVISPVTGRPIKYDGLTGSAILRDGSGVIQSYDAFAIQADRNLANRAEIATDIDPRTGTRLRRRRRALPGGCRSGPGKPRISQADRIRRYGRSSPGSPHARRAIEPAQLPDLRRPRFP